MKSSLVASWVAAMVCASDLLCVNAEGSTLTSFTQACERGAVSLDTYQFLNYYASTLQMDIKSRRNYKTH
jgi:hypothetical protein